MLSIETYLSFLNYEGIGARNAPIVGVVVKPDQTPEEPKSVPVVVVDDDEMPRRRRPHWAIGYQKQFSAWLSGKGEKPNGLDYTRDELRDHLRRQFSRGMSWSNYAGNLPYRSAKKSWVVDHIVPKRLFSAEDVGSAYALCNLRPLWMDDNILKGGARVHLL